MIATYLTRVHSDKKGSFLSVFIRKPGQSLCQFDQREVELKYNQSKPLRVLILIHDGHNTFM